MERSSAQVKEFSWRVDQMLCPTNNALSPVITSNYDVSTSLHLLFKKEKETMCSPV